MMHEGGRLVDLEPELMDGGTALYFLCPCKGHHLCLPLQSSDHKVKWTHAGGEFFDSVTITPSVRVLDGCKAHFNITDGKIMLHQDNGQ